MENLFITGYSNEERHSAIISIKAIIANFGDIVDFKLFSDISLTVVIEVQESKIDKLYEALNQYLTMSHFDFLHSISNKERTIYLNISFTQGTGNLNIEQPSVPG
jgi:hypothetical protein